VVDHDAGELNRLVGVSRLDRVLRLIAANNAGELVRARIARDADMPESTLPGYLRLLQDLFMIHLIPAWGRNLTARVVGRPKAALLDSGLAAHLAGVTPQALSAIPGSDHLGGLLEGFVAGELRRQQTWSAESYTLGHFRDRTGTEVDLVVETRDGSVIGIQVKSTRTVTARMFRGLEVLRSRLGSRFRMGLVLHTGPDTLPFGDRMWAAPVSCVWAAPGG
jgi:predicted AAA+ superfamily ATPase